MAADGWLVLRFAAHHLGGPSTVVERTRRALRTVAGAADAGRQSQMAPWAAEPTSLAYLASTPRV
jgi:hypothetical protein